MSKDDDDKPEDETSEEEESEEEESEGADEEEDEEEEEEDSSSDDGAGAAGDGGSFVKSLGIERWVQFAFVGLAVLTFFVVDKLVTLIWDYFAEPISLVSSAAGAIVGALTGFLLYRHPRVNPLAHEVAGELAKVTWPSRKETWYSSVVVIVTSIIAAVYVGLFDAAWSWITDQIYKL